jgi:sporulation protein YlmC with PRC-barrel domain
MMQKTLLIGMAFIGAAFLFTPATAEVVQQTVQIAKVDVTKLAAGYRASKIIGSSVINDENETIGTIEDLLVSPDGKAPFAVLSIGGFLGIGSHLVVVPFDNLKVVDKKLVLPGGTKDSLRALPEFKYASE